MPYSILSDEDYVGSCGAMHPGATHHDPKIDRCTTPRGCVLTLAPITMIPVYGWTNKLEPSAADLARLTGGNE